MSDAPPTTDAAAYLPASRSLAELARAAERCRGCELYRDAEHLVFGEGTHAARLMLVGEMPGNDEDLAGRPFVGPAGRMLDGCLEEAGIHRGNAYVTNIVKHFKWTPRGKRRLHQRPSSREVDACLPWFEAELEAVQPSVLVCLGATAARALLGPSFRVSRQHGEFVESNLAPRVTATGHPSAILRQRGPEQREAKRTELVTDLRRVRAALADAR